jgi:hypothetical protein
LESKRTKDIIQKLPLEEKRKYIREKRWDTNAIAPGTHFMEKMTAFLKHYVIHRMNYIPAWDKVSFSLICHFSYSDFVCFGFLFSSSFVLSSLLPLFQERLNTKYPPSSEPFGKIDTIPLIPITLYMQIQTPSSSSLSVFMSLTSGF